MKTTKTHHRGANVRTTKKRDVYIDVLSNDERAELQRLRALVRQYEDATVERRLRDLRDDLEALRQLAVFGWAKEKTSFGGNPGSGLRGDGRAANFLAWLEDRLDGLHHDARQFLERREDQVRFGGM